MKPEHHHPPQNWKDHLYIVIFESDTPSGKFFDVVLLWVILLSVLVVMLESVQAIETKVGSYIRVVEWVFTIIFTIEYMARIICVYKPWRYVFSFFGLIDFLSIVPTYLSVIFAGTHYLIVIRAMRLLRVFRILKLGRHMGEAQLLTRALIASRAKITVFLLAVLNSVVIVGTVMYMVEGGQNGFTSIPRSIYWAVVTLTTVGYGDISPHTVLGQFLSSIIMILGYGIIAVPTGIVTVELNQQSKNEASLETCPQCFQNSRTKDANYCRFCGFCFQKTG